MRELAILLVGVAPLALLTAWSIVGLCTSPSRTAPDADPAVAQAAALAAQGRAQAEAAKHLAADVASRRIGPLAAQSVRRQQEEQAAASAAQAKTAFEQQASARLQSAATPAEREAVLAAFLQEFSDRAGRTEAELLVLRDCRRQLDGLRAQASADARLRDARAALKQLEASPPSLSQIPFCGTAALGCAGSIAQPRAAVPRFGMGTKQFEARVARAAEILRQYPDARASAMLGPLVRGWVAEEIPPKRIGEPPLLEEAQTKDGALLRGYFRQVTGADGSPGYKRYATHEDLLRPKADVGTHPARDFLRPPGPSVLCSELDRYHAARQRLLEHPGRRRSWVEFVALCDTLQRELEQYRRKPGAAQEPLRFGREAEFARRVLSGSGWQEVEGLGIGD